MSAQLEQTSTEREGRNALAELIRRASARETALVGWGARVFSALLLLSLLVCALHVYAVARQTPQNSDSVQGFLEAQSILHGNPFLSGWRLTSDNYLFTDAPFFVAYQILFGHRVEALAAVPSIIYVLILIACLAGSVRSFKLSRHNVVALATVVLLIGLPASRAPSADPLAPSAPLFLADFHAASILFSLVSLILLARLAQAPNILDRPLLASTVAFSCILAVGSDPLTVIFAFGPAILVLLIDVVLSGGERKYLGLTALVLFSLAVGLAVPGLISRFGGFHTIPIFGTKFVDAKNLGDNVRAFSFGLLYSADAYFFGRPLFEIETMANLARLFGWILGVASVLWTFSFLWRHWRQFLLDRMILVSIVTLSAACVLSDQFSFDLRGDIFQGGRGRVYLTPIVVLSAVLAARVIPIAVARLPLRRLQIVAQAALVAFAAGLVVLQSASLLTKASSPAWVRDNPYVQAGRWLETNSLTRGVGGYFDSSIIRALTDGGVAVNAVYADAETNGRLKPFLFDTDSRFFSGNSAPMFVIWREGDDPFDWYKVNADTVEATYGAPTRIEHLPGGFVVEVLREPQH